MKDLSRHRAPYTLCADCAIDRMLILRIRSDFANPHETQNHEECCSKKMRKDSGEDTSWAWEVLVIARCRCQSMSLWLRRRHSGID